MVLKVTLLLLTCLQAGQFYTSCQPIIINFSFAGCSLSLKRIGKQPLCLNHIGKLQCHSTFPCWQCAPFLEWKCFLNDTHSSEIARVLCQSKKKQCSHQLNCGDTSIIACPYGCSSQNGSWIISSILSYNFSRQPLNISCSDGPNEEIVVIPTESKYYVASYVKDVGICTRNCRSRKKNLKTSL